MHLGDFRGWCNQYSLTAVAESAEAESLFSGECGWRKFVYIWCLRQLCEETPPAVANACWLQVWLVWLQNLAAI